jgi:hypothetical protein
MSVYSRLMFRAMLFSCFMFRPTTSRYRAISTRIKLLTSNVNILLHVAEPPSTDLALFRLMASPSGVLQLHLHDDHQ